MLRRTLLAVTFFAPALAAQVAVTPVQVVRFGGLADDTDRDLYQVRRVVRLANGQFVVATRKPLAVRVFAPDGRELGPLGRIGEGPGEFRSAVDLGEARGDTIAVVSHGTRRWMRYTSDGTLMQEFAVDSAHPMPGGLTMWSGHYTRHTLAGSRGCPSAAVLEANTPRTLFTFVEALTDGAGRTWRRDVGDPTRWHVHDAGGTEVASVRFPVSFVIHQFSGDLVVGLHTDADDADHVMMFRVPMPAARGAVPPPCEHQPTRRDGVFRNLAIHTRNAMTAGQALASDYGRFLEDERVLNPQLLVIPAGAELKGLHISAESWIFAVSHLATGAVCVGSTGPSGLPGWEWGEIGCSATGGRKQ